MKNFTKFCCIILCFVLLSAMTVGCGNSKNNGQNTSNSSTVSDSESAITSGNSSIESGLENNSSTNSVTNSSNQSSTANSSANETGGNNPSNVASSSNSGSTSNTTSGDGKSEPAKPGENSPMVWLSAKVTGKTVTVTANIKNNPGLSAFKFFISYDKSAVKPNKLSQSDLRLDIISNLDQSTDLKGDISAVYISASGFNDNGALFSITFDLLETNKTNVDFTIKHDNESFLKIDAQTYADFFAEGITVKIG